MQHKVESVKQLIGKSELFDRISHLPATHRGKPYSYWNLQENQRAFLLNFANDNFISTRADWNKVTVQQVIFLTASNLILRFKKQEEMGFSRNMEEVQ